MQTTVQGSLTPVEGETEGGLGRKFLSEAQLQERSDFASGNPSGQSASQRSPVVCRNGPAVVPLPGSSLIRSSSQQARLPCQRGCTQGPAVGVIHRLCSPRQEELSGTFSWPLCSPRVLIECYFTHPFFRKIFFHVFILNKYI